MLVEQFVASVGAGVTKSGSTAVKDVSILTLELQPTQARRSAELKKSTTAPNCLAISSSHIYAAQSDKAIVNVYNREKGSLEATVPFKEKITCLALACQGTLLVLGTEHGRLYLWETLSGRQLSTPQAHLQAITTVVVDPTSNFILSGSLDATIHVWSLPALVSFSSPPAGSEEHSRTAPIRTFSSHRNAITSITLGHSASFCNYAVSASKDGTVIVWDYHTETILRTVLLPDAVFCVTLDPADRAIYAGFEDGSIQSIDLLDNSHSVADTLSPNTASTVQPAPSTRWVPPSSDAVGAAHTLLVSYDGTRLITGHNAGKILVWDIPTGTYASNLTVPALSGPVTNLAFIPITGYPATTSQPPFFKQSTVVKPRFGEYDLDAQGRVPESYTLSLQYTAPALDPDSDFYQALTHPSFPAEYLDECIHELAWSPSGAQTQASAPEELDTEAAKPSNSETEPRRTGNAGGGGAAEYEDDGFISLKEQKDLLHSKKNTATRQAAAAAAASSTQLASSSSEDSTTLLKAENARLKQQIAALKRVAKKSLEQVDALSRR